MSAKESTPILSSTIESTLRIIGNKIHSVYPQNRSRKSLEIPPFLNLNNALKLSLILDSVRHYDSVRHKLCQQMKLRKTK